MVYRVCKSYQINNFGKRFVTYGIRAKKIKIEDISLHKRQFRAFVACLNQGRLDPVHLYDVINDFLLKNCNRIG